MLTKIWAMGPGWPKALRRRWKKCEMTRMHDICMPMEVRGLKKSSWHTMRWVASIFDQWGFYSTYAKMNRSSDEDCKLMNYKRLIKEKKDERKNEREKEEDESHVQYLRIEKVKIFEILNLLMISFEDIKVWLFQSFIYFIYVITYIK